MKMRSDQIAVYDITNDSLFVVANCDTEGMEWPLTIHDPKLEVVYHYKSNETMLDWMIGRYGGHAKYVKEEK